MTEERKGKEKERLGDALLKVALGYQVAEVTEEYAEVDGELKLMKRKKTKKDVPPDLKAVQMLLSDSSEEFRGWSDEQLEEEKVRLLTLLKKAESEGEKVSRCEVKKKTTEKKTGKNDEKRKNYKEDV